MAELIARFAGIVSYSDGSHAHFAVHLDRKGNLSYNGNLPAAAPTGQLESKQTIIDDFATSNWVGAMIAQLPNIAVSPGGSLVRTPIQLQGELSGRVTVDSPDVGHPTWEDFIIQYSTSHSDAGTIGATIPSGATTSGTGGTSAWVKAKATVALKASLNTLFTNLGITVS